MSKLYNNFGGFIILILILLSSCKKDWLNQKQEASLNVPSTLKDVQEIMNGFTLGNLYLKSSPSGLGEVGSDDCVVSDSELDFANLVERNHYLWKKDSYEGALTTSYWGDPCAGIYLSNQCLDVLNRLQVTDSNKDQWELLKGQALFFRAYLLYDLSQVFCKPYVAESALADPGLPIPLKADININLDRSNVQRLYDQIISDLQLASSLIKVGETERNTFTPGKAACEGMLARVYLSMSKYSEALKHSENSLLIYNQLMDFNIINSASSYPFVNRGANVEILSISGTNLDLVSSFLENVPNDLFISFSDQDLRKRVLFRTTSNGVLFRGSYQGNPFMFSGLTTSEVYMINAECKVRTGDIAGGIARLNQLLKTRYDKTSNGGKGFQGYVVEDSKAALNLILSERRKELFRRGLRWGDLRRLNKEFGYAKTLTKSYKGKNYSLPPNDMNYTLQIPPIETKILPNVRHDIIGQ